MSQPTYGDTWQLHAQKMRQATDFAAATLSATLQLSCQIVFGYPAVDVQDSTNGSTRAMPRLNVWPLSSNVTQTNATPVRYEEVTWGVAVSIPSAPGQSAQAYMLATEAVRIAARVIEQYAPDPPSGAQSPIDPYCIRVDQLGVDSFRPEGASGALAVARLRATLGSTYQYTPLLLPPELPSLLTPARDASPTIALTISTLGVQDSAQSVPRGRYTELATSTTPPPATSICLCVGTYGAGSTLPPNWKPEEGWALDLQTYTYSTPSVDADGLQFAFDPNTTSFALGRQYLICVWTVDPTLTWSGIVRATAPDPA